MKRFILTVARICISLLLLFAGGSFPVTAGSKSTVAAGSFQARSAASTGAGATQLFLPLVAKNYVQPAPLWRFGTAVTRAPITAYDAAGLVSMRLGWYINYGVSPSAATPYGMEYIPTIRVKQNKLQPDGKINSTCCVSCEFSSGYAFRPSEDNIESYATNHPGATWLIGNEMDSPDKPTTNEGCNNQDAMLPEVYAQAYHDLYRLIKDADPTAQVAIGALVEFTPLRRQYLDRVWAEYTRLANLNDWPEKTMPVDIWNIHMYMLQEKSCTLYPGDCWGAGIPPGFPLDSP